MYRHFQQLGCWETSFVDETLEGVHMLRNASQCVCRIYRFYTVTLCRTGKFSTLKMYPTGKVCAILSLLCVASGCPTWYRNTSGHCECGVELSELIICHDNENTVDVSMRFCMTYDYSTESVVAGYCRYGYSSNMTNRMYSSLPTDPTQLNETTCGPYNREGLFCGYCIEGFGPAVYSTDLSCANCTDISTGLAIMCYLLLQFLPVTVFFLLIAIFHFNITSGPMLGYVMFCQGFAFTTEWDMFYFNSMQSHLPLPLATVGRVSMALADIWNLHFFRFVLPSFCLSDRMTGIHVQMLSFLTAVYPVLLMVTTYIAIELHARNCRCIHFIWKLFGICFSKFQNSWSAGDSVIHTFATFIMLSSYTVTYDTLSIAANTNIYHTNGVISKTVLYYDPTIVAYSSEHIPYLVVAVVVCFLIAVCPALLLCLYPTRLYERLSRCWSPRKRIAIKTFAEALHSCFKNGLNGTRDYRAVSGFLILAPLLYFAVKLAVRCVMPYHISIIVIGVLYLFVSALIVCFRPCKSLIMNLSFSYHLMLCGILFIDVQLWIEHISFSTKTLAIIFVVLPAVSHILILMWAGYRITDYMSHHIGDIGRALAMSKKTVLRLCRRHDYEELRDSLTHN